MAVLPENSIDLSGGVEFVAQPSLTWKIDRAAGRIAGTCDGYDAVKQAVEIILNVERYRWQIYQPASGMQWDGLVGQEAVQLHGGIAMTAEYSAGHYLARLLVLTHAHGDRTHHLGALYAEGLVTRDRDGRQTWYAVNPDALEAIRQLLDPSAA